MCRSFPNSPAFSLAMLRSLVRFFVLYIYRCHLNDIQSVYVELRIVKHDALNTSLFYVNVLKLHVDLVKFSKHKLQ